MTLLRYALIKTEPRDSDVHCGDRVHNPEEMVTESVHALRQLIFELASNKSLCFDIRDMIRQRALRGVGRANRIEEIAQLGLGNTLKANGNDHLEVA